MERKHLKRNIILIVGVICLILMALFFWRKVTKIEIIPFGESVILDSEKEEEARKKWMPSNYCRHKGKIELQITSAEIYDSPKDAGIEDIYLSDPMPENEKQLSFLLVTYTVHNIDADAGEYPGFHSGMFRLSPYHEVDRSVKKPRSEVFPDAEYCSVFKENVEKNSEILERPKEGQYYQLEKGETKEIQNGYYVDMDAYKNGQLVLTLETGSEGSIKTALEIMD